MLAAMPAILSSEAMEYKIAGVCFSYTPRSKALARKLKPFASTEPTQAQITLPEDFGGETESVALLRQLSLLMLTEFDGMLFHGVALGYQGKGYLFIAPSGIGKTTHAKLWEHHIPGARILNGDKPFVRCAGDDITLWGSPWQGKENYGENGALPLAGIFLLSRGEENRVETLQPHAALSKMLAATVVPKTADGAQKVLTLLEKILGRVPVCRLWCNMQPEAALVARRWTEEVTECCK